MARALGVLIGLAVLAACAPAPAPAAAPAAPSDVAGAALDPAAVARWADFTVDARPRPLLLDALPAVGRGSGAIKFLGGFDLAAPLPADPPRTLDVDLPDGRFPLATITAAEAFAALSSGPRAAAGPDARISAVRLDSVVFGTDRGGRSLPAWVFTVAGTGSVAWPAISPQAFRVPQEGIIHGARVSADGRTLTVTMPAGPTTDCPGAARTRLVPVTLASRTAVDIGLRSVPDGPVPGDPVPGCGQCNGCGVAAMQVNAIYSVPLAAPLGNRVLLGQVGIGATVVLAVEPA